MFKLVHMFYAIINKHFNFCWFRALAYTTLDRLWAVFLYNIDYSQLIAEQSSEIP